MSSVLDQLTTERKEILRIRKELETGYHLIKRTLEPKIKRTEFDVLEQIRIARKAGSNERAVQNLQRLIKELVHENKDVERIVRTIRIRTDELDRTLRQIPGMLHGLSGVGTGSARMIEQVIEVEFRKEKRVKQIETDETRRYRDERRIDHDLLALRSLVLRQLDEARPDDTIEDQVHERVYHAAERFFEELNIDIDRIEEDAQILIRIANTTAQAIDRVLAEEYQLAA